MKSAYFLVLGLLGCGGRVDPSQQVPQPEAETGTGTDSGSPIAAASELLRTEPEMCAFGAGAGHLVWIDAATREVKVARAVAGSEARSVGRAHRDTCALSVRGTRYCFGDAEGSLTCVGVDGADYEIHGERRASDPVRAVDLGRDRGLMFARRRTAYGRFGYEATFNSKTVASDITAVAGDFDMSPDDGTELGFTTDSELFRMGFGEAKTTPIVRPLAVEALHYGAYLLLGADGLLRTVLANEGTTTELPAAGAVRAFAVDDRSLGENLVVARDEEIVAMNGKLWFEPEINDLRTVAPAEGEVVSLAIDEREVLWATRGGQIRRAKLKPEPR